jgi:hypothetical protein
MDDFEVRTMIRQPSWDRCFYQIYDNLLLHIPSRTLLEELIFFPKVGDLDPFNVDFYRIRPQEIEIKSLLLLQSRSNSIIHDIKNRQIYPTEIDLYNKDFCDNNNISYIEFKYLYDTIDYVHKILPGVNLDVSLASRMNTATAEIISKNIIGRDNSFIYLETHYPDVYKLMQKTELTHKSHRRRFTEYRMADDFIHEITDVSLVISPLIQLEECLRQNENNEKLKRKRQKENNKMTGLGFKNIKKQKKSKKNKHKDKQKISGIRTEGELAHFKNEDLVMPMNDVLAMVEDNKGTTISLDFENKHVEVTDYRILAQCLFCNRFRLCKPSRVITRSCDRNECKKKERAWRESLDPARKDIDIETVSPSGF